VDSVLTGTIGRGHSEVGEISASVRQLSLSVGLDHWTLRSGNAGEQCDVLQRSENAGRERHCRTVSREDTDVGGTASAETLPPQPRRCKRRSASGTMSSFVWLPVLPEAATLLPERVG